MFENIFKKHGKDGITYGIIGLGRFGTALAQELGDSGADLVIIGNHEESVREMRQYTENAFVVQSLDKKTLLETGIQNCDVAIVCIGEKLDVSILTTLTLISLGIPKVIAKAHSTEHGDVLEKLGAEVIYPERDMAIRLARRLETSKVLDLIQLSEQINISKLAVPSQLVGKSVLDVNFRAKFNLNIIAIVNSGEVVESVRPDYVFRDRDILFVSGNKTNIEEFVSFFEK